MIVELLVEEDGVIRPLIVSATTVIIRNNATTPISVAVEYGDKRQQEVARIGDHNFNAVLRNLGINDTPTLDRIVLPQPASARLVAGPGVKK